MEMAVAEMAKMKHLISCKALIKPPKDQKPPPFTSGLPNPEKLKGRQYCKGHNSWNHFTNSCVVFRDVIQEGIKVGRLKLVEKPPTATTDPFPQPQVNMVNLKWPEQEKGKLIVEVSPNMGRRVTK
ncbi:unnamed protein product [Prunus armeniaca]